MKKNKSCDMCGASISSDSLCKSCLNKPVFFTRSDTGEIKDGQYFILNTDFYYYEKGTVFKIEQIENSLIGRKVNITNKIRPTNETIEDMKGVLHWIKSGEMSWLNVYRNVFYNSVKWDGKYYDGIFQERIEYTINKTYNYVYGRNVYIVKFLRVDNDTRKKIYTFLKKYGAISSHCNAFEFKENPKKIIESMFVTK